MLLLSLQWLYPTSDQAGSYCVVWYVVFHRISQILDEPHQPVNFFSPVYHPRSPAGNLTTALLVMQEAICALLTTCRVVLLSAGWQMIHSKLHPSRYPLQFQTSKFGSPGKENQKSCKSSERLLACSHCHNQLSNLGGLNSGHLFSHNSR